MSKGVGSHEFTSIKTVSRSQEVKAQLLEAIRRGDYEAGAALPSERELSEVFGVSRVSVREAIRSLEAVGVVEVFQGRGSFVSRGPGERYLSPFSDWLHVHRAEVLELMQVRGALDELASSEAARHAGEEAIDAIERAHQAFEAAAAQGDEQLDMLVDLDIAFHVAIGRASGSVLLTQLLDELNQLFTEGRKVVYAMDRRALTSAREHAEIVAAIRAHDPTAARDAAASHLAATRALLAEASTEARDST
jgi:DNA-binding FadR family transcriptional regulator